MKTTAEELTRRAQGLPPGFEKYVISHGVNNAKVQSFSSETIYDVHIKPEGTLDIRCNCPAGTMNRLCHHATAFFAVAKGLSPTQGTAKPDEGKEPPPEPTRDPHTDGMKMIAGAIEMLVDGIGLVVSEKMKEATKE